MDADVSFELFWRIHKTYNHLWSFCSEGILQCRYLQILVSYIDLPRIRGTDLWRLCWRVLQGWWRVHGMGGGGRVRLVVAHIWNTLVQLDCRFWSYSRAPVLPSFTWWFSFSRSFSWPFCSSDFPPARSRVLTRALSSFSSSSSRWGGGLISSHLIFIAIDHQYFWFRKMITGVYQHFDSQALVTRLITLQNLSLFRHLITLQNLSLFRHFDLGWDSFTHDALQWGGGGAEWSSRTVMWTLPILFPNHCVCAHTATPLSQLLANRVFFGFCFISFPLTIYFPFSPPGFSKSSKWTLTRPCLNASSAAFPTKQCSGSKWPCHFSSCTLLWEAVNF